MRKFSLMALALGLAVFAFALRANDLSAVAAGASGIVGCFNKTALAWNTFSGAGGAHRGEAIVRDSSGNSYILGTSSIGWGASPINGNGGGYDAFVLKLDPDGHRVWHTFLGGLGIDLGKGICLDGSGNIFVVGESSQTWGTPKLTHSGGFDIFVAALDSGGARQWNTFLGSGVDDRAYGLAWDGGLSLYILGESHGTWGSPLQTFSGGIDIALARMGLDGTLAWNTFVCASGIDQGRGAIVADGTNVHIDASSASAWGSPKRPWAGGMDAFVAELGTDGHRVWNTFLGSNQFDQATGLAGSSAGGLFVTGESQQSWGTPVRRFTPGMHDVFAAKVDGTGRLAWNTFLGSAQDDYAGPITLGSGGAAYVTGSSTRTWGEPFRAYSGTPGYLQAFAARLTAKGVVAWNAFLGASGGQDTGRGITVDSEGNVVVVGESATSWGTPVDAHSGPGGSNAFAALIAQPSIKVTSPASGYAWVKTDLYNIAWTATGYQDDTVGINLLRNGTVVHSISSGTPNDGLFEFWQVPDTLAPGTYKVKVITLDGRVGGTSANFQIIAGLIDAVDPTPGAVWTRGTTQTITWDVSGCPGATVRIQLLNLAGVVVMTIADSASSGCSGIRTYSWPIPLTLKAGAYKIRIKVPGTGGTSGTTAAFTIN